MHCIREVSLTVRTRLPFSYDLTRLDERCRIPVSFLSGVLSVYTESTPQRKDTGVFEIYGRFIIVLLDQSVTITIYICVLFINNPMRGNLHTLHCHV